jgi:phosphatidylserine/phosphatidylglycerophosphate/cardiolipin synthase-like enzyme
LTNPHCDVCQQADKDYLLENSVMIKNIITLIDNTVEGDRIDIAQFTFSRKEIEEALLAAHQRGVEIRLAMNHQQSQGDNVSTRLLAAGLDVRFIKGKDNGSYFGLLHAKFMIINDQTLLMGSNNWSSTGTSINEENTVIVYANQEDKLVSAFSCYFEAVWENDLEKAPTCTNSEAAFTPSTRPIAMLKEGIRGAEKSVDVLMHHFLFSDLVKVLAQAAERGVKVRVIINVADRDELRGSKWDRLFAAGGQVRYKQTNTGMYQLMHHKLAVVDKKILLNGSGNWSGSAFFNNFEFYTWMEEPEVVQPFVGLFERLWSWSLSADSLDNGLTAARQDANNTKIYFGNLHSHHWARDDAKWLDDGRLEREIDGELVSIADEMTGNDGARYAFEYARDVGQMDFLGVSPHVYDDDPADQLIMPNMSREGYQRLRQTATLVTEESAGSFVGLASMEWNTNSMGNHLNVLGASTLCKSIRGDFNDFYDRYLAERAAEDGQVFIMLNHPRTFRSYMDSLGGAWDQIFEVDLRDIPKNSQRTKKFNDYGLDDYPPLADVRNAWIEDGILPDPQIVKDTMFNIEAIIRPYARLMELTIGRSTDFRSELRPNPDLFDDDEDGIMERVTNLEDWNYFLLHGYKLAPTASHDNHYANWGTGHSSRTGLIAETLSTESILDAIARRSLYASEDENLEIRFYADGRFRAGESLATLEDQVSFDYYMTDPDFEGTFKVNVYQGKIGGEEIVPVLEMTDIAQDSWQEIVIDFAEAGKYFIYIEVIEAEPNRMAWSAPIWLEKL